MNSDLYHTLIDNPSFIEWVHSDFADRDEEWSAYIDAHPEDHDEINKAIRDVRALRGETFHYARKSELFNRVEKTLDLHSGESKITNIRPLFRYVSWAASLVLVLGTLVFFAGKKTFNSQTGQSMIVQLPDDSKVHLNAQSTLQYHSFTWLWDRKVSLEGEAFFDVEKGRTFTVQTNLGVVNVLGTSFNVDLYEDRLSVFCYTGKVSVKGSSAEKSIILYPEQGVNWKKEQKNAELLSAQDANGPDWMSGYEKFENEALENVVDALQKYYDEKIIVDPNHKGSRINATVPINNIDSALQNITWPLGLKYTRTGDVIRILK